MVFSILVFGIIISVIFGFFVFVAKIKFAKEIFSAKVDVNVFNHSLALCFIASGLNGIALSVNNIKNHIFRCWDDDIPSLHSLAYWHQLWPCKYKSYYRCNDEKSRINVIILFNNCFQGPAMTVGLVSNTKQRKIKELVEF